MPRRREFSRMKKVFIVLSHHPWHRKLDLSPFPFGVSIACIASAADTFCFFETHSAETLDNRRHGGLYFPSIQIFNRPFADFSLRSIITRDNTTPFLVSRGSPTVKYQPRKSPSVALRKQRFKLRSDASPSISSSQKQDSSVSFFKMTVFAEGSIGFCFTKLRNLCFSSVLFPAVATSHFPPLFSKSHSMPLNPKTGRYVSPSGFTCKPPCS